MDCGSSGRTRASNRALHRVMTHWSHRVTRARLWHAHNGKLGSSCWGVRGGGLRHRTEAVAQEMGKERMGAGAVGWTECAA